MNGLLKKAWIVMALMTFITACAEEKQNLRQVAGGAQQVVPGPPAGDSADASAGQEDGGAFRLTFPSDEKVVKVRVKVFEPGSDTPIADKTFTRADTKDGNLSLPLADGTYTVKIEALDKDDQVLLEGSIDDVVIKANEETNAKVTLSAKGDGNGTLVIDVGTGAMDPGDLGDGNAPRIVKVKFNYDYNANKNDAETIPVGASGKLQVICASNGQEFNCTKNSSIQVVNVDQARRDLPFAFNLANRDTMEPINEYPFRATTAGQATIKITVRLAGKASLTKDLPRTVREPTIVNDSLKFAEAAYVLPAYSPATLKLTVKTEDGWTLDAANFDDPVISSQNQAIAAPPAKGGVPTRTTTNLNALAPGKTVVTGAVLNLTATVPVTVKMPTGITLTQVATATPASICVNSPAVRSQQLFTVKTVYDDGSTSPYYGAITWTSSNPDVIGEYSYYGFAPISPGTARVTAKISTGQTASINVTVTPNEVTDLFLVGAEQHPNAITIGVNATKDVFTYNFARCKTGSSTWIDQYSRSPDITQTYRSANPTILEVRDKKLRGLKAGTTAYFVDLKYLAPDGSPKTFSKQINVTVQ